MPGLINAHCLTASSSTQGEERDVFWKNISSDQIADDRPPLWLPSRNVQLSFLSASHSAKLESVARLKQVTDPLNEVVKARLYGDVASAKKFMGSEHDPSSVCLAAMVNEFIENEGSFDQCGRARGNCHCGNPGTCECPDCNSDDANFSIGSEIVQAFEALVRCSNDSEAMLLTDVRQILGPIAGEMSSIWVEAGLISTHSILNQAVMTALRKYEYNAAICKSRWDHSCDIPSGAHEYIDVLGEENFRSCDRLIVDIDFRAQFEIARPTVEYTTVWQLLPPIFVGKPDRLHRIIHFMSEAAKQSLKLRGLHLPPWRKPGYLKAKWFSPYQRSLHELTHSYTSEDCVANTKPTGISLRGQRLYARCSNESDILYQEGGPMFLSRDHHRNGEDAANKTVPVKQTVSEGAVWSSRNCHDGRNASRVTATEWQPPALAPRSTQKLSKVTGLASVLMQAGLADSHHAAAKEERLATVG